MGQFCANIILIRTSSNFIWVSVFVKNHSFKSQVFSSSQKVKLKLKAWLNFDAVIFFNDKIKNLCQFSGKKWALNHVV